MGRDSDRVWMADWTDLCVILLSPQPVCCLLSKLCRTDKLAGPWCEITLDVLSKYGDWKINVLIFSSCYRLIRL